MKHLNRRSILLGTVGLGALAVAGCSTTQISGQIPVWVAGLQAIATEITLVVPQLQSVGLGGNTLTSVQTIVAEMQKALSAISAASTATQGQSVITVVEGYINALAPLILPFVSLIPGGSIIGLIVAALPAIEVAVNFVASLLSPQALQLAATAPVLPAAGKLGATISVSQSQQYLNYLIQQAAAKKSSAN